MKLSYQLPRVVPVEGAVSRAMATIRSHQLRAVEREWRDVVARNIVRDTGVDFSLAYAITDSVFRTLSENVTAMPPATLLTPGDE